MFQLDLALLENICVCAFLIDISFFNYPMSHLDMTNDLNGCVNVYICKVHMLMWSVLLRFHLFHSLWCCCYATVMS